MENDGRESFFLYEDHAIKPETIIRPPLVRNAVKFFDIILPAREYSGLKDFLQRQGWHLENTRLEIFCTTEGKFLIKKL